MGTMLQLTTTPHHPSPRSLTTTILLSVSLSLISMQVKKEHLELYTEKQTGSKLGKEYIKAVYCHPTYLNYMQSMAHKMLDRKTHKLESRLLGEMSITSDKQMTPP